MLSIFIFSLLLDFIDYNKRGDLGQGNVYMRYVQKHALFIVSVMDLILIVTFLSVLCKILIKEHY